MFYESRRRELHTGSLRPVQAHPSRRDRVVIVISLALVVVALILVIVRRDPERAPAPPAEVRVVTVPVPMPIEKPVPVVPAPVEAPAPKPVVIARATPAPRASEPAPAPPAAAAKTPSADELVALYRSVGQTLQQLDQDRGDALRARFRWIRLADYLETPEKRAEAARMLDAIASDARGQ